MSAGSCHSLGPIRPYLCLIMGFGRPPDSIISVFLTSRGFNKRKLFKIMSNFMHMAIIGSTVHYKNYLKITFMLVKSCFHICKACPFWKCCAVGYCFLWDESPSTFTKKLLAKSFDSFLTALANGTPLPQVPLEKFIWRQLDMKV